MPVKLYRSSSQTERKAPKRAARIKRQVELYECGMSFGDIALKFHMSENYVRHCINKAIKERDENG